MNLNFPIFPIRDMNRMAEELRRQLVPVVTSTEAIDHFHMRASNGKVYKVTISDLGVLTTTEVQG